ncbi:HSP18 transcriptional regulator [Amycolatopsis sp. H20-H5]|uniref:HSP18 transcriptional regulator n=1 Tax=Amycolatopsis sp. H20-H5 TaxID=3046309 RepID=UPI002DB9976E|nr:HSP18 transcriptional regulator [Amycolatopsis sp. H20-H5]MEC3981031.1 HSP18 transcriptional regulator [Amycolatopsis sp. H20-H5]
MDADPLDALRDVLVSVLAARDGTHDEDGLLAALSALRSLREELSGWEPELITAARAAGVSWAALAPALGVASRQAAERRYLRLQPSTTGESTGEARVDAQRARRAADRAVADWAREHTVVLRALAGQVSALENLGTAAQKRVSQLGDALGNDDPAELLRPLAATQPHLGDRHSHLAHQVGAITEHTEQVRRDATHRRNPAT